MPLNALKYHLFTKIFTLAIAPCLFILVGVFCEFAMVPVVYILLSPQEEEVHYSSCGYRCTHSAANSSKDLNLCLTFHICFWFQWMSLSNLFLGTLILRKSLLFYLGCGCVSFNFKTQMTSGNFLPHADE